MGSFSDGMVVWEAQTDLASSPARLAPPPQEAAARHLAAISAGITLELLPCKPAKKNEEAVIEQVQKVMRRYGNSTRLVVVGSAEIPVVVIEHARWEAWQNKMSQFRHAQPLQAIPPPPLSLSPRPGHPRAPPWKRRAAAA